MDTHSEQGFGRFMFAVGLVGLVATAVVIVLGLRLVDRTGATLAHSLELTAEAVSTVDATINVAADSISTATQGLTTLSSAVANSESSLLDAGELLSNAGSTLSEDVPASIDAIRETMPALIQSAGLLDTALSTLSVFGVDFAPPTPPADSLRRVESGLAGIADRLRQSSDDMTELGDGLQSLGTGVGSLAVQLDDLERSLQEAEALLDGYSTTTSRTAALVEQTSADLESQRSEGRLIVLLLGLVIALGQAVPLGIAWHNRAGRPKQDVRLATSSSGT
ncbi:MAG: hypothetical protein HKN91_17260 [Acidimicrobiia bacterium]|nr:hypothetical protein [Acidimicrobiia bacterium]